MKSGYYSYFDLEGADKEFIDHLNDISDSYICEGMDLSCTWNVLWTKKWSNGTVMSFSYPSENRYPVDGGMVSDFWSLVHTTNGDFYIHIPNLKLK